MSTGQVRVHTRDGTGYLFPALSPSASPIDGMALIEAGTMGVSKICRYGGHVLGGVRRPWQALRPGDKSENVPGNRIYSVLQHEIILSHIIEIVTLGMYMPEDTRRDLIMQALIHDHAEGLGIVDMPGPVKGALARDYDPIESKIEQGLAWAAGVPYPWNALVKRWDKVLYHTEARDLQRSDRSGLAHALPLRIRPMASMAAVRAWGKRWAQVKAGTLPSDRSTLWNEVRFIFGVQYMTTGEELHGVWRDRTPPTREVHVPAGMVLT
jgi:hypothetical protein